MAASTARPPVDLGPPADDPGRPRPAAEEQADARSGLGVVEQPGHRGPDGLQDPDDRSQGERNRQRRQEPPGRARLLAPRLERRRHRGRLWLRRQAGTKLGQGRELPPGADAAPIHGHQAARCSRWWRWRRGRPAAGRTPGPGPALPGRAVGRLGLDHGHDAVAITQHEARPAKARHGYSRVMSRAVQPAAARAGSIRLARVSVSFIKLSSGRPVGSVAERKFHRPARLLHLVEAVA